MNKRRIIKNILGTNLTYKIKWLNQKSHLKKIKREKDFFVSHPEAKNISKFVENPRIILDIGANYGVYTYFLAKKYPKSKIYSFEPSKRPFDILLKTIKYFRLNNVHSVRIALGNENKEIFLINEEGEDAQARISLNKGERIKIRRLDDFLNKEEKNKIDFMKIDVEGFETEVIKGALDTIKKSKPVILMEVSRKNLTRFNATEEDLIRLMENINYEKRPQGETDCLFILK